MKKIFTTILAVFWGMQALSVVAVLAWYLLTEGGGISFFERSAAALVLLVGPYVFMRSLTATVAHLSEEGLGSRSTTEYDSKKF
jgi:hypothetical protein